MQRQNLAVKIISGLLYPKSQPDLLDWAREHMSRFLGPIERESEAFPFDYTDYYRNISSELLRRFFSFSGLRHPCGLVSWKKQAIEIESCSAEAGGLSRRINVDPGYIDGARLVLASTKDNAHRIYMHDDIYAEVTLCRRKHGWESFSYTFPDFASGVYNDFLETVRRDWQRDIRNRNEKHDGLSE